MSYRDDFSSNMNSPSNYKGNTTFGNPSYQGGYGGTNNAGLGFTTPSQRNFAAQGGSFGRGFGFGSLGAAGGGNYNDSISSGPIQPALGPQGVPAPNTFPPAPAPVTSLPPALTAAGQYANPFRWPTQRRANMGGPNFPYNNGFNGRPAANYPQTPQWAGGPTYNPNVGGLVSGSGGHAMGGGWNPNPSQFGGTR
jgi:hypothetical protein